MGARSEPVTPITTASEGSETASKEASVKDFGKDEQDSAATTSPVIEKVRGKGSGHRKTWSAVGVTDATVAMAGLAMREKEKEKKKAGPANMDKSKKRWSLAGGKMRFASKK
jgi:hypothetical protein